MFNSKKTQKVDEIDTVVGLGTKFEGKIEATGIVHVDGAFSGELSTSGDLVIGKDGSVEGKANAKNIIIAGISHATLTCVGKLEIKSSGKVYGDVEVEHIVIEEKAIFEGKCFMKKNEDQQKKEVMNG